MHIVLAQIRVARGFSGGGVSRSVHARARMLVEAGHEVTILSVFEDPAGEVPPAPGVRLVHVPYQARVPRRIPALAEYLQGRAMGKWLLQHGSDVDIVDAQEPNIAPGLFAACDRLGIRKTHTLRMTVLDGPRRYGWFTHQIYRTMNLLAARRADRCLAISSFVQNAYLNAGIPAKKIRLIPNAFDIPEFPALLEKNKKPLDVLWIGRFAFDKGLEVAIPAACEMLEKRSDIRFTFVGRGPKEESAKQMAGRFLENGIHFAGHLSDSEDIARLRASQDIYICTTRHETFGRVLAEGMAAGLACISSDLPVTRELLSDAGLFYDVDDSSALAAAIERYADDADLRLGLGKAAYERCKATLDWKVIQKNLVEAYEELINSK